MARSRNFPKTVLPLLLVFGFCNYRAIVVIVFGGNSRAEVTSAYDKLTFFVLELDLEVDRPDIERLLWYFPFGDVRGWETELDFTRARLRVH